MSNEDVHLPKLGGGGNFAKYPHCIYFYYIGPVDSHGNNTILHYYYAGDVNTPLDTPAKVEAEVELLIDNARIRNVRDQLPPPIGENWKYVVWDRISHIAFAFDIPNMTTVPDIQVNQLFGGTENHSFFDARPRNLRGCDVILCANHMKRDEFYNEVGRESQYFHFDIITDPELNWPGKRRYPDSGGTNMGPPVPPP